MIEPIIYKDYIIEIKKEDNESDKDFSIRKWFILKNIHNTYEYSINKEYKKKYKFNDLVNLSIIYIYFSIYNCTYDEKIIYKIKELEKNI
tara:strand:+ start:181 stop:450 length:270 start_codon:yes stop_codon:yes gene_type:complete